MKKSAMTSVNKPFTDKIFALVDGDQKTIEWRTKPLPRGLHYVYETKNKGGCGKVIGEMTIIGYMKFSSIDNIPDRIIGFGKVDRKDLKKYAKGRPLYANAIVNAKRYDTPKELGEFWAYNENLQKCFDEQEGYCFEEWSSFCRPLTQPPQSWRYVVNWQCVMEAVKC
ncbi:MAG: hypothetical protein HDT32_04935 [Clostridiales bacterium]|nr:hypothetical protein [Clostridiales bacterium]